MKCYIISGEASGDLHGANLMKQIKLSDPNAVMHFLGWRFDIKRPIRIDASFPVRLGAADKT